MKPTFRDEDAPSSIYAVPIPQSVKLLNSKFPVSSPSPKTALFAPRSALFASAQFQKSSAISDQVLITKEVAGVLATIFKHGQVAPRYGETGLETDPSRQQIIVYTAVRCQDHFLWYQRAGAESRLQGKYSLGFGGHKTAQDIQIGNQELVFLDELLPAIKNEIGVIVGINKGFFAEVEEELGLRRADLKSVNLLGAFHDMRFEDPNVEIQVGWVHTGIAAVVEVDESKVAKLSLQKSEIAHAWWVPEAKLLKEYETKQKAWISGKGPRVESWSEIMIKEFLTQR